MMSRFTVFILLPLFYFQVDRAICQDRRSLVLIVNDAKVSDKDVMDQLNKVFEEAEFKLDELHILDVDTKRSSLADEDNLLSYWKNEKSPDYEFMRKRIKNIVSFQTVSAKAKKGMTPCNIETVEREICTKLYSEPILVSKSTSNQKFLTLSPDQEDKIMINSSGDEIFFNGSVFSLEDANVFNASSSTKAFKKYLEREFNKKKEKQTIILYFEGARKIEPLDLVFKLDPAIVSTGMRTTLTVEPQEGIEIKDLDQKTFKITPQPADWSQSGFQATFTPRDSTVIYKISVVDKYGCSGDTTFKVPFEKKVLKASSSEQTENSNNRSIREFESDECDCGNDSQLECLFGELNWEKYKRVNKPEYIIDGYLFFSRQSGERIYDLITSRNCAERWKMKIYNRDNDVIYEKTYTKDYITSSGILLKPGFENYYSFKIDLSGGQFKDQWLGDNFYTIVIESFDANDNSCSKSKSPNIIFTKCPE